MFEPGIREKAKSLPLKGWIDMVIKASAHDLPTNGIPVLPSPKIQKITNGSHGPVNMEIAGGLYERFFNAIDTYGTAIDAPRILDFGCGWGRLIRFLPQLTDLDKIIGADVDKRLIGSCKRMLSPARFQLITSGEKLPFEAARFDIVISNSVFTHLSEQSHLFHMREIARILKPGGLFLGTTLSPDKLSRLYQTKPEWINTLTGSEADALKTLNNDGFIYGKTERWVDYGLAFVTQDWIQNNWSPEFEILEQVDGNQQLNVARRT